MSNRRRRDERRPGIRVVLGPRDEALLRALARLRVARTDDLVRLLFPNVRRDTAATRLRRLHDGGFLQARTGGLNEQNLYHLGPAGVRWAEERGIPAGRPPEGPRAHHLAIVRVWTALAAALHASGGLRLARFEPDWELRSRFAGTRVPVLPDAAVEIVDGSMDARAGRRFVLEVDLTTERPGVLQRKLAAYDPAPFFSWTGSVDLIVVLFGAGERRASSVRALVDRAWPGESFVWGETQWPEMVLRCPPEASLGSTPCREGRLELATPTGDGESPRQGEEPSR